MAVRTLLIIGAMKAGTTSLHAIMAQHPMICSGRRKELDFFLKDRVPDAYAAEFPRFDPARHRLRLDASPNLSKAEKFRGVPDRVRVLGDAVSIVYILRDPIERLRSHIQHNTRQGRWSITGIGPDSLRHCIEVSSYAAQLDRFREAGLGVTLVDFAALAAHPKAVVARMLAGLGLPPMPRGATYLPRHVSTAKTPVDYDLRPFLTELSADVRRLVEDYGFLEAEEWPILRDAEVAATTGG